MHQILELLPAFDELFLFFLSFLDSSFAPSLSWEKRPRPSPVTEKTSSSSSPLDLSAFRARLDTFRPLHWPSLPSVSPAEAARRGFTSIGPDLARCVSCSATVYGRLASSADPVVFRKSAESLRKKIEHSAHAKYCPWAALPSPEVFVKQAAEELTDMQDLKNIAERILSLGDQVPRVSQKVRRQVVEEDLLSALAVAGPRHAVMNSLVLAMCGWRAGGSSRVPLLSCGVCKKKCPVWLYRNVANEEDSDEEEEDTDNFLFTSDNAKAQDSDPEVIEGLEKEDSDPVPDGMKKDGPTEEKSLRRGSSDLSERENLKDSQVEPNREHVERMEVSEGEADAAVGEEEEVVDEKTVSEEKNTSEIVEAAKESGTSVSAGFTKKELSPDEIDPQEQAERGSGNVRASRETTEETVAVERRAPEAPQAFSSQELRDDVTDKSKSSGTNDDDDGDDDNDEQQQQETSQAPSPQEVQVVTVKGESRDTKEEEQQQETSLALSNDKSSEDKDSKLKDAPNPPPDEDVEEKHEAVSSEVNRDTQKDNGDINAPVTEGVLDTQKNELSEVSENNQKDGSVDVEASTDDEGDSTDKNQEGSELYLSDTSEQREAEDKQEKGEGHSEDQSVTMEDPETSDDKHDTTPDETPSKEHQGDIVTSQDDTLREEEDEDEQEEEEEDEEEDVEEEEEVEGDVETGESDEEEVEEEEEEELNASTTLESGGSPENENNEWDSLPLTTTSDSTLNAQPSEQVEEDSSSEVVVLSSDDEFEAEDVRKGEPLQDEEESEDDDEGEQSSIQNLDGTVDIDVSKKIFHPLREHLPWCPWVYWNHNSDSPLFKEVVSRMKDLISSRHDDDSAEERSNEGHLTGKNGLEVVCKLLEN